MSSMINQQFEKQVQKGKAKARKAVQDAKAITAPVVELPVIEERIELSVENAKGWNKCEDGKWKYGAGLPVEEYIELPLEDRKYNFATELKALFETPRTLRDMKYTSWSETRHTAYSAETTKINDYYMIIKGADYYRIMGELKTAVSQGGNMSEELLSGFVFSDLRERVWAEEQKTKWEQKPAWCSKEVWNVEIEKKKASADQNVIGLWKCYNSILDCKMEIYKCEFEIKDRDEHLRYSPGYTPEENQKKRESEKERLLRKIDLQNLNLKSLTEKYDELQRTVGIAVMPIEERLEAETTKSYGNKRLYYLTKKLCGKSEFVAYIKSLGTKEVGRQKRFETDYASVIDLKFKTNTDDGEIEYTGGIPYHWEKNEFEKIQLKTLVGCENIYMVKGAALKDLKRTDTDLCVPKMFRIISKRQKLYTEGLKGEKDKMKDSFKPFEPFEECGIEVLYVNLGFKSDGTKTANRNKGTLPHLKNAYTNNKCGDIWDEQKQKYVKDKTKKMPTKKEELAKLLYKV